MHPAFRTVEEFTLGETAIDFDTNTLPALVPTRTLRPRTVRSGVRFDF